jgi:hypothetical protein
MSTTDVSGAFGSSARALERSVTTPAAPHPSDLYDIVRDLIDQQVLGSRDWKYEGSMTAEAHLGAHPWQG